MSLVYLDTSVALAQLLAEDQAPPDRLWHESLISSRLLEYELWTRVHARGLAATHAELVRELVARVALVELVRPVVQRATDPFPAPVRTLDALHLATVSFLTERAQQVSLASYDSRMLTAARALSFEVYPL
jgi:hypothetical protein